MRWRRLKDRGSFLRVQVSLAISSFRCSRPLEGRAVTLVEDTSLGFRDKMTQTGSEQPGPFSLCHPSLPKPYSPEIDGEIKCSFADDTDCVI